MEMEEPMEMLRSPEGMIAVSKIYARALKKMSLAETKTFAMALTQIQWTKSPSEQSNVVFLDKKVLAEKLNYKSNPTDLSQNLWQQIKHLHDHSNIEIAERDRGLYSNGSVIATINMHKRCPFIRVKFEEDFFPLFTGLDSNYITFWSDDIYTMTTKRSVVFYEQLRQISYGKYEVSNRIYGHLWGIKALKELFDIPENGKGSYMRENDGFDRKNFERYVLDPICKDLANCKMIQLIPLNGSKENEKKKIFYEKVKSGNRVLGYQFYWVYTSRPGIASAITIQKALQDIEKDPRILKIAIDVAEGKKNPSKKKCGGKQNEFNNFKQNTYDFDALEEELLALSM